VPARYGRTLQVAVLIVLSLPISSLTLLLFGVSPYAGIVSLLENGFGSYQGLAATLTIVTPLLILAVGMSVPFTAKTWNIGGQGQYVIGSILSTWIGLKLAGSFNVSVVLLVALIFGFIGGALWAIPPTVMKLRFGTSEIITTFMMNFIAIYLLTYLISGPLQSPLAKVYNIPTSATIPAADFLPKLLPGTDVTVGLLVGLVLAGLFYVVLNYSTFGYELKLIGDSQDAARYAGVSIRRTVLIAMIISGGISGIAGMVQIFGSSGALLPQSLSDITASFGYVSIPVALIASLNPIAIVVSSVFFGGILHGGYALEQTYGVPIDVITTIFGIVMIFSLIGVTVDFAKVFRRQKVVRS